MKNHTEYVKLVDPVPPAPLVAKEEASIVEGVYPDLIFCKVYVSESQYLTKIIIKTNIAIVTTILNTPICIL